MVTAASTPARSYSWPEGHWDWYQHLAFKHGVRAGRMIFVGGQVDKDARGEPQHVGDLAAQTATVVRHVDTVLRGFDAGLADVVSLVAFYATDGDVDEQAFLADVGRQVLANGGDAAAGPAILAVPLPCLALPGMRVEIEAIAMLGEDGTHLARETVTMPELAPLPAPFAHGVRSAEHVWVSGMTPRDAGGRLHAAHDVSAQNARIFDQAERVLAALDADVGDAVRAVAWYRGDGTRAAWAPGAAARAARFAEPFPVTTELPTPRLPAGETARLALWAMRGPRGERLPRTVCAEPPRWSWPVRLPYAHALRCADMVFVGGQLPLDPHGRVLAPGDLNAQTRAVMEYTRDALAGFDLGLDHMVKQTSFYLGEADPQSIVTNQRLRSSHYREPAGASTGVPLPAFALEDVMVTVETVAMTI
ncbi:MAG: RidA family protein [Gammaproteobacteria bacterium]|nr:RidA family protein [Gammaproteobacteria bacterium]